MLNLFRKTASLGPNRFVNSLIQSKAFSTSSSINLDQYDASQTKFLDESLILVDKYDKVLGKVSKVDAHLNAYNQTGSAHRAFSVFLFNQQNQLLIHQRSEKKITFPLLWTNSCCSHPLHNEEELVEEDYLGAKKAIRRRVNYELGYDLKDVNDLHFLGKIFYHAECDKTWGEHEIDYCFFIKRDFKASEFNFNKDEIQEVKWVGKDEIMDFLASRYAKNERVTPWFGAIMHYKLFEWWDVLNKGNIKNYKPAKEIADLNSHQKPIFSEANGLFKSNISSVMSNN